MALKFSTDELLNLYKIAVEEYRFEVNINWNRTMYYMVFNTALISAATALLRAGNTPLVNLFVFALYATSLFCCVIGEIAVRKGHEYYRRTVVKKTLLEDLLGLTSPLPDYASGHTLSIGTTIGQAEHIRVLHGTENWLKRGIRSGSITLFTIWFLRILLVINFLGAVTAIWLFLHTPDIRRIKPDRLRLVPVVLTIP